MGVALALVHIIDTNSIRVTYALYKALIQCNSHEKQLYSNTKTKRFSCKGECGVHKHMRIEIFKRADLGYK